MRKYKEQLFERLQTFSFAEMVSNGNGKTSGSGSMGVLIIIVGCFCFVVGSVYFALVKEASADIMIYSASIITIGAGLLGYRKSKDKVNLDAE